MLHFSVIVPTYNRAPFITEAIDSVLQQTYHNYELIVVDDGSTDDTGHIIQERYGMNPKVSYYLKANEERGAARNYGLQRAKGEYALFFDSDDWMLPNYLQSLYDAIVSLPSPPFFIAAKYRFRDETGREWSSSMEQVAAGWYNIDTFLKGNMLACNFCVKLENPDLKPFPRQRQLASMEDWLFLLDNLQHQSIYITDATGVVMREHSGRSMANNRNIIEARKKATEWALNTLFLTKQQQRTLKAFSSYFCGIHEYLEGKRRSSLKQSIRAVRSGGAQLLFIILFLKSIVGKRNIDRIRNYAS